ncbi:hypothetical protein H5U35_06515 [Candidatus Aerophobetes bacterium]|nr:hypothetical protein [Candidatus Aerophobetes bacterium]
MPEKSEKIVVFLSNGYAEDNIACCIIKNLLRLSPFLKIKAAPFVGEGISYKKMGVEIIGPCRRMPSDGFVGGKIVYLLKDLNAGILNLYWQKIKALRRERKNIKCLVCVGDIFLVVVCAFFIKKPVVFLPTAKSDYIKEHYFVEKWLMRRFCRIVFPRDSLTAFSLKKSRINAVYLGNPMMDCLEITGEDFGIDRKNPVIAILPGSKEEAYDNLLFAAEAARYIFKKRKANFLVALSSSLDVEKVKEKMVKRGWKVSFSSLKNKDVIGFLSPEKAEVKVIRGKFGDVVNISQVVIGTAGMANEQAVGLGKPVVSFAGRGPQITEKFLRTQRKLLGGAVFIVKREPAVIGDKVLSLLEDKEILSRIKETAKERMGEKGAAPRIAKAIFKEIASL